MAVGLRAGPGNGGEYPLASILRLTFNGKARTSSMGGRVSRFSPSSSADFRRPETIIRRSNVTVLANGRSTIPGALPGRGCRCRERRDRCHGPAAVALSRYLQKPRSPERGLYQRKGITAALRVSD